MDISVVIPAYNEENYIVHTIASIKKFMPVQFTFEIIVVDHGSTDETSALAEKLGAMVLNGKGLPTIASLRNFGVESSKGDLLFFIDADVTFTDKWAENISEVIASLREEPNQICGSLPNIPEESSVLLKYWFSPKSTEKNPKYIGSCHLLIARGLFEKIGGFPKNMETGEDFNLCQNAKKVGAKIAAHPNLVIYHNGAPRTLATFAKREVWHGRGDWTNLSSILSSKVAMLTIVFLFTHLILLTCLVIDSAAFNFTGMSVVFIIFICFFSSFMKFSKQGTYHVLVNSCTFYIYFFARSLSLFSALFSKKYKKRSRSH